jgi:flagellar motor switch protein FliN
MSDAETQIETVVDAVETEPQPEAEAVDYVPFEATVTPADGVPPEVADDLERLRDVPVELAVEIGRTRMTIGETLALGPGSIITLNRLAGEPVDLLVNGKPIARGEVVVIDEEFGLRVTDVVTGRRRPDPAAE